MRRESWPARYFVPDAIGYYYLVIALRGNLLDYQDDQRTLSALPNFLRDFKKVSSKEAFKVMSCCDIDQ